MNVQVVRYLFCRVYTLVGLPLFNQALLSICECVLIIVCIFGRQFPYPYVGLKKGSVVGFFYRGGLFMMLKRYL